MRLNIKKNKILLSAFLLVLLTGLVSSFLFLKIKAASKDNNVFNNNNLINISAVTDELIYTDGILVYTSAENSPNSRNAAVTSGEEIIYSLELTNQGNAARTGVNLKFTLPKGYTHVINTTACTAGITPCQTPPEGALTGTGTNQLTWAGVSIPMGESKISFKLKAP